MRRGRKVARWTVVAALAALLAATVHAPSWAGTSDDPEITSDCGGSTIPTTEKLDICTGWFEGVWADAPQGSESKWRLEGIQTYLTVDSQVAGVPEHAGYSLAWSFRECRQSWMLFREADAATWTLLFHHDCPDDADSFGVVLPASRLTIDGNRIGVLLVVDEDLKPIRDQLGLGTPLGGPSATSWVNIATGPTGAFTVEWDATGPGRTFILGQDIPS